MTERIFERSGKRDQNVSEREKNHGIFAKKAAEEGIVLLKNEGVLPLDQEVAVALLGCGAEKTVKGGIGSGDVNNRKNSSVYQGLKEAGITITSENWIKDYHNRYEDARNQWKVRVLTEAEKVDNPFDAYADNPFEMPEGRPVQPEDMQEAKAAIYVISRISGEGKDRRKVAGDYYLSEREKEDIQNIAKQEIPVILILNAGGPVELTDILEDVKEIKAVLNISQLGQEGGYAVADILLGKTTPSGKLTTTWARHYEDYPCAENFSYLNGNLAREEYQEGIYVGYRYFDTCNVKPLFPFGYGLSYTEFQMRCLNVVPEKAKIAVDIEVKNIGSRYAGKEVVQVYAVLPQTECRKEYRRLVGFAKTALLNPGETEKIRVEIEQKELAYFSENEHAWVIEKGRYMIEAGNSIADAKPVGRIEVAKRFVLEQTKILKHTIETEDYVYEPEKTEEIVDEQKKTVKFEPTEEKFSAKKPLLPRYPVEDLIPLLYGNIAETTSTIGSAGTRVPGSAGETTEGLLDKYQVPSLVMADGPAGIRLQQCYEVNKKTGKVYGIGVLGSLENGFLATKEVHEDSEKYYQYCTAFPVGTALAQTWNTELLEEFGEKIAYEMNEFHVNLWLAPGLNIQRNPLCGRNFEYYSEDPLVSGKMTAAVTKGVQSRKGCGVTIKHFAGNNQEDNRMGVDVRISERALREIYLRGFEIAVKESDPIAIMSSYNLINGVHAANNEDLCTTIARDEWGFDGVIMSDWNTTVPEDGSIPWMCAAAGNDIIMPGNPEDDANIREAVAKGKLTEEQVRVCAGRILDMIYNLSDCEKM